MDELTRSELKSLMGKRDFLCASMYMPTHRTSAKQDPIRLKNLLKKMTQLLIKGGFRKSEAEAAAESGRALVRDPLFWHYQSDGLALFISPHCFRYYRLPISFKELLVVTDRFHIRPLLPLFADNSRFFILALSQNEVRLIRCSRNSSIEVAMQDVPGSLNEALRFDEQTRQLQFHTKTPGGQGERAAIFHGQGAGKDEEKDNILKFFHLVDKGVQKLVKEDTVPLILSGVEYLFPIYRQASGYAHVWEQGIPGNPECLKPDALRKEAWKILEPYFRKTREKAALLYRQLAGSDGASNDIKEIVPAAYAGKIDILFTPVGIQQWGFFDPTTLSMRLDDSQKPGDEDLQDFAAACTLSTGGTVYALKPEEVPDPAHLAAVLRH